ncbi:MAG: tetratricopeptide repeat protein [Calothrix sp. SM1_5_4]|nr:tetratricopeptide repeat protein [Calothrix sp. SM1_5_4]
MKRLGLLALTLISLSGCTFSLDWFRFIRAQRAVMRHDYPAAIRIFQMIAENEPDSPQALSAARQGARVAHLEAKNYPRAVDFYKQIVLRSPDVEERKSAQRYIAQIYFENLLDYDQAVIEYERLLKMDNRPEENFRYRLNLAKAHFQLNNLGQSMTEIDVLLSQKHGEDEIFEAKTLKANIQMANKQLAEAAETWEGILTQFPERSQKENVALNLVVCYEELKEFGKAIGVLERMKPGYPDPDFVDLRIERLKERKANLPGAQGWRR